MTHNNTIFWKIKSAKGKLSILGWLRIPVVKLGWRRSFFFCRFLYPPHQVKQTHKSYCTVLQSANIMNWHKLVYTFHFMDDKKNQKKVFLCPVGLHFHRLPRSHRTASPDFIAVTLKKLTILFSVHRLISPHTSHRHQNLLAPWKEHFNLIIKTQIPERDPCVVSTSCTICRNQSHFNSFYCIFLWFTENNFVGKCSMSTSTLSKNDFVSDLISDD